MTRAPSDAGMLAKVARALVAVHSPLLASDEHWPKMVSDYHKMCAEFPDYVDDRSVITDAFRNARAAIDAMREPTTEMIAAAWKAFRGDRTGMLLGPGPAFKEAMQAMCDAALRDGEG